MIINLCFKNNNNSKMSLNDYMILEKLGNGSYSSVFKGKILKLK